MTNEAKSTGNAAEVVADKPEGLSTRDALEVAIEAHKEPEKDETKLGGDKGSNASEPRNNVREKTVPGGSGRSDASVPAALEPPAQWTKEEKEDFKASTPKQQEASLRLHQTFNRSLSEMSRQKNEMVREAADLQWAKDIAKQVEPFLKVRGSKEPVHAQILKAIEAVNQLDTGDPLANAAEYIKAKGKEVPKALLDAIAAQNGAPAANPEITSLRKELDELKQGRAREEQGKRNSNLTQSWHSFAQERNAAGVPKFPDVDDSPEGLKLSRNIGSLVYDDTPLSRQYIASVQARIPNLSWPRLIEEAYRYFGGKVDDSSTPRTDTQENKIHLVKSSRAASSRPGGGAQSAGGPVKKFASRREAAAAAYATLKEQEES